MANGSPGAEEAAELLAAVLEASAAGIAVLSGTELRFERANAAFRALTPRPDLDPVGRPFEELWPAPDPLVVPALRRALETGAPCDREDQPLSMGGLPRRFSVHVQRLERRRGPALLVVVWETTALWQARRVAEEEAERALRRASELEAIVDALPDAFVLYGTRGEILRMNAAAERLFELPAEERGLPFAARWGRYRAWTAAGQPVTLEETPLLHALAGERVRGVHLRVEMPTRTAWVLASAAPIRAPGGAVAGVVAAFSDETGIQSLEEARKDLVRMVSHDLRTPLNAVLAQAHLLRRDPSDPARVVDRARAISRSCDRMSAMIQDLLDATLLEAGQLRMSARRMDLAAFVPEAIERQRGALDVERVVVIVRTEHAPVQADPERLERILVNLLSNALKYSPPQSEVLVEIASAGEGATVTVTDRGVGIAPEDLPHIFDRFFRARGARQPEGLGLGLYITRLLAQAHGGRVEVESRLGSGSTFRLLLPGAEPLAPRPEAPQAPAR